MKTITSMTAVAALGLITAAIYALWMMQRIQKKLREMPEDERTSVVQWFADRGQVDLLKMDFGPDVERAGLTVRLAG